MLHVGLDLSRRRLDVCVLSDEGELVEELAAPPDVEGLRYLVDKVARHGQPVCAVIESMTGARFVHDTLEQLGWDVLIADAQRVKGLAPLACKTDRVDSRVLAVLSHRNLVPAIWLPDPRVRREREQARFRLHLVKHKSMPGHRIHATLMTFGHPCPVSDLFGLEGRKLLERLELPQPWRETLDASLYLVDYLESEIESTRSSVSCAQAALSIATCRQRRVVCPRFRSRGRSRLHDRIRGAGRRRLGHHFGDPRFFSSHASPRGDAPPGRSSRILRTDRHCWRLRRTTRCSSAPEAAVGPRVAPAFLTEQQGGR